MFYSIFESIFSQASLISAVFISCKRFYAIYWPLNHRTLSMRAYRILSCMLWTLGILVSAVFTLPLHLISNKITCSAWISFLLTLLFIVCGCIISISRKFQHENMALNSQQEKTGPFKTSEEKCLINKNTFGLLSSTDTFLLPGLQ